MPSHYMYSPTTPSYSPSYRPASFAPRKMSLSKAGFTTQHQIMFHGSWILGVISLSLAIWYTRIIYDASYAQNQMQSYPKLVPFLQTNGGKALTAILYILSILFGGNAFRTFTRKVERIF